MTGIDADSASLEDIRQIPPMMKPDLMTNWNDIVTVAGVTLGEAQATLSAMTDQLYIRDSNVLIASGGTGGQPGIFLYDWTALATNLGSMSRSMVPAAMRRYGGIENLTTVTIGAEVSTHGSYVMSRIFSNPLKPAHRLSAWRSTDELVVELNRIKPTSPRFQ